MARRTKAPEGPLGSFAGIPVSDLGIAFRNAGDGLSEELKVNPVRHDTGDTTYWVLKCVTGPIDHEPLNAKGKKVKGDELQFGFESYRRVEDQMTIQAIEVQADQVEEWLESAAVRATTARLEREAQERRDRGEVSLDDALGEANSEPDED